MSIDPDNLTPEQQAELDAMPEDERRAVLEHMRDLKESERHRANIRKMLAGMREEATRIEAGVRYGVLCEIARALVEVPGLAAAVEAAEKIRERGER